MDSHNQLSLSLDELEVIETITAPAVPAKRKQEVRGPTPAELRKWREEAARAEAIRLSMVRDSHKRAIRFMTWCEIVTLWNEVQAERIESAKK